MTLPRTTFLAAAALCAGTALGGEPAVQTPQEDYSGIALFRTYCASCHGSEAKGDGPLAQYLKVRPADLTQIAKRSEGTFPAEKVRRIIDGREPVRGHGGSDMPVWGDAFKQSHDDKDDAAIKAKIQALVEYLQSAQTK